MLSEESSSSTSLGVIGSSSAGAGSSPVESSGGAGSSPLGVIGLSAVSSERLIIMSDT